MTHRIIPVVLFCLSSAFAHAQTASDEELVLELTGVIEPRCELTRLDDEAVAFNESNKNVINFNLYCNLEMSIRLESANGGLLNSIASEKHGISEEMYRRYDAKLSVDSIGFEKSVSSTEMVGGTTFPVTGGVAFESSGNIEIELDEDGLREGYAGVYVDQIKISVFPSLSNFN